MIDLEEKKKIWKQVSGEFPTDTMLRDLHFIRTLMDAIERTSTKTISIKELGFLARKEFQEWLERYPEMVM